MGLLSTLLTLPVSGPVKGIAWVAQQAAEMAEEQMAGGAAEREFVELQRAHLFGELNVEEYRRREEALWERLQTTRWTHGNADGH